MTLASDSPASAAPAPRLLQPAPKIIALRNVKLAVDALDQAIDRPHASAPAICVLYGVPGLGKTMALGYCAGYFNAISVRASFGDTGSSILRAIALELGLALPQRINVASLLSQVIAGLRQEERPLLVDEFDRVAERSNPDRATGLIELFRDLHDGAGIPLLLVGEQNMPVKLRHFGRFFSRIRHWVPACPTDLQDARELARLYCPAAEVSDDLLALLIRRTRGSARDITNTLGACHREALTEGIGHIDAGWFGDRPIISDPAPLGGRP